ncbi:sulfatase-like hydrolase/transferase [Winogradskyella sp. R77965]|uniref:sulfatase-like hydrolase/transferase n=1 Tax=Winogradskyella sp. R77965 TaxID=3093872 RepID=UPI0037DD9139
MKKHLKKLIVLQYLLAVISFVGLIFAIYNNLNISSDWQGQPDDIAEIKFKKKPNVYFIQPDGYVNFSELKRGFYNYDNSTFESFLDENEFTSYPDFRSNYSTTLSSNASFFMMKHHYYNRRVSDFELYNARNMIISKNPVLDVFKANGYKTYYISETDYLLYNRPKMGYDYCNINYIDLPFIKPAISEPLDISKDIEKTVSEVIDQPKFFFLHFLSPWHIKTRKNSSSNNKDIERNNWLANLNDANKKLTKTIKLIKHQDPNALIIIMADHGGYVGFEYGDESEIMHQNRDLIYSEYSSQLSISWPNNDIPKFNDKFKSSVNLFRLLFSHLSENDKYSEQLQGDESYKVLRHGVEVGIYKYIDGDGNITLESLK